MREIIISGNEANQRFDKFLAKYLNKAGKSFIYKMLRKKNITLNGKKDDGASKLAVGDVVNIYICEESIVNFTDAGTSSNADMYKDIAYEATTQLDIVYEDSDIIIINKPVGMLSQKASKDDVSANEYIIRYLLESGQLKENELSTFKPSVCNRLDRNTSGLLVFGKSLKGLQEMSKAFKERTLHKYYICLVDGVVRESRRIDGYLKKDEKSNKVEIVNSHKEGYDRISTEYIPLGDNGKITLLMINLITGKPHQIRAHLAYEKTPVIGDYKYGFRKVINNMYRERYGVKSQLLHAYRLVLSDGKSFVAEPPDIFLKVLQGEGLDKYLEK